MCSSKNCSHGNKKEKTILFKCDECGKSYSPDADARRKKKNKPDKKTFCSVECFKNSRKRPDGECLNCGKVFPLRWEQAVRVKEGSKEIFCSAECSDGHYHQPDVTLPCNTCGTMFQLTKKQKFNFYNLGQKDFYCTDECYKEKKSYKVNNGLCSVEGCNAPATHFGTHRWCEYHHALENLKKKQARLEQDLLSLFIIQDLVPDWALRMALVREEFVKVYILEICKENFIRQERETLCGIEPEGKRRSIEEDILLIDLRWMISCKRNGNTTTKEFSIAQLERSMNSFSEFRPGCLTGTIVAIDNTEDIADVNLLQWSKEFKRRVNRAYKSGRMYLPLGIRAFNQSIDARIELLANRFEKLRDGSWIHDERIQQWKRELGITHLS